MLVFESLERLFTRLSKPILRIGVGKLLRNMPLKVPELGNISKVVSKQKCLGIVWSRQNVYIATQAPIFSRNTANSYYYAI